MCSKRLASYTDASSTFDAPSSTSCRLLPSHDYLSSDSASSPTFPSVPFADTSSSFSIYSSDAHCPFSSLSSSSPSALHRPDDHPISLRFEDGTVATCDVLIGADGLKSRVRVGMMERMVSEATRQAAGPAGAEGKVERAVAAGGREAWAKDAGAGSCERRPAGTEAEALAAAAQPVWSGFVAYRVLISADKLRERAPEHSLLSNPMLVSFLRSCRVRGFDADSSFCSTSGGML